MIAPMKPIITVVLSTVVTLVTLWLFIGWDFAPIDAVAVLLLVIGAGIGWWARGVWER